MISIYKPQLSAPVRLNKYYTQIKYGGYSPCILGNPNVRPSS